MLLDGLIRACSEHDASITCASAGGEPRTLTFGELAMLAADLRERLVEAGLRRGHIVGLRAGNSLEWVLWDLALSDLGAVMLAFPEDMSEESVESELAAGNAALHVDGSNDGTSRGRGRLGFALGEGTISVRCHAPVCIEDDLHSLTYSSGTTGGQKGLKISRKGSEYVIRRFIQAFGLGASDRHLIFLPFSNYQQRLSLYGCLHTGASVSVCSYQKVFQSMRSDRPTFLIAPPLFYESALQVASHAGSNAERLHALFGGGVRFLITGMAPIRRRVLDRYWEGGLALLEAYGMTEAGMIAWNTPNDFRVGTVGRPLDRDDVRITAESEIIIRREYPLSLGYFTAADDAETFIPGGEIATGDLGHYDPDGFLILDGRKKDIVRLSNGRTVNPVELEDLLRGLQEVTDAVAVPSSYGNSLVAVLVVEDHDDPSLRRRVTERVVELNGRVQAHMRVSRLVFTGTPIAGDPRFMTRNLKLNRTRVLEHFQPLVNGGEDVGSASFGEAGLA